MGDRSKSKKGLITAAETVIGLIGLLLVMATFSGGYAGLPGLGASLVYSVLASIPLVLVVFLSLKVKNDNATAPEVVVPVKSSSRAAQD